MLEYKRLFFRYLFNLKGIALFRIIEEKYFGQDQKNLTTDYTDYHGLRGMLCHEFNHG